MALIPFISVTHILEPLERGDETRTLKPKRQPGGSHL
jgi:hypothetical protein